MKYSNDKYNIIPPYQLNPMLSKNPLFTTTNLTDYTVKNNNKYSKIKSKYKTHKTKSITTG